MTSKFIFKKDAEPCAEEWDLKPIGALAPLGKILLCAAAAHQVRRHLLLVK